MCWEPAFWLPELYNHKGTLTDSFQNCRLLRTSHILSFVLTITISSSNHSVLHLMKCYRTRSSICWKICWCCNVPPIHLVILLETSSIYFISNIYQIFRQFITAYSVLCYLSIRLTILLWTWQVLTIWIDQVLGHQTFYFDFKFFLFLHKKQL